MKLITKNASVLLLPDGSAEARPPLGHVGPDSAGKNFRTFQKVGTHP
jgi:hypothetical protein